jgi:signal transduction histidine kinase/iron only hydrogenase large subunit-like protein
MPHTNENKQLVYTIKELCRMCYTCVRECPAKAIRIFNGQAEVITERCIGCGNCIKVCSQDAKVFLQTRQEVKSLLKSEDKVAAIVAPSFPAEFRDISDYQIFIGMIKSLGFDYVFEVGFGADLVALQYKNLLSKQKEGLISSDCPAIVNYIRFYHPILVENLAPIVSPMVAMARVVRKRLGDKIKIVFIGPCIAKKDESPEIDIGLTFRELRAMIELAGITEESVKPTDFDLPKAGKGAIFPISRGLTQTINLCDDMLEGNVIATEGRKGFQEAIREFEEGYIKDHYLELLCCEGCIMGPGMSSEGKRFERRTHISNYVQRKFSPEQIAEWQNQIEEFKNIDLHHSFNASNKRLSKPSDEEVNRVLASMGKFSARDHLNCGACGYDTCTDHAIAITQGLAEVEMCLPYTIEELHESIKDLAITNEKLAQVQQALKHSEKLAHMGQLSAGIAHELNNPLGIILMYSNILLDEVDPNNPQKSDLELISTQAQRCKKIVSGLLNFARKNQVKAEEIEIKKLVEDSLHSVIIPENICVEVKCSNPKLKAYLDNEQMIQLISNLCKNAIEAMPKGGKFEIDVSESLNDITIQVKDYGIGIPEENKDKLFTPFFTTKGIGKGTGLGLATIYGIVKMHKGKIEVDSNTDQSKGPTGTTFRVTIPKKMDLNAE